MMRPCAELILLVALLPSGPGQERAILLIQVCASLADPRVKQSEVRSISEAMVELAAVLSTGNTITADDIRLENTSNMDAFAFEETTLEEYTMRIIRHFLDKYNNNVVLVARKLGVGKSTIYRYIKENKLQTIRIEA